MHLQTLCKNGLPSGFAMTPSTEIRIESLFVAPSTSRSAEDIILSVCNSMADERGDDDVPFSKRDIVC